MSDAMAPAPKHSLHQDGARAMPGQSRWGGEAAPPSQAPKVKDGRVELDLM